MKKKLSFVLAVVVMLSLFIGGLPAKAQEMGDEIITEEDLFIDQPTAEEIAKLFLQDMMKLDNVSWTRETEITSTTILYGDTNKDSISAYGIHLSAGYIVVSAYLDVPNLILEWSDLAEPVYDVFGDSEKNNIIYRGVLNYYKACSDGNVETIDGSIISADRMANRINEHRNISNVPQRIKDAIIAEKKTKAQVKSTLRSGSDISDIYTHASTYYGGTYTLHDSQNHWGSPYLYTCSDFENLGSGFVNHCGPTAITNMLLMYGMRFSVANLAVSNRNSIFLNVASIGTSHFYYVNTNFLGLGGTYGAFANSYICDCFSDYGISVTCTTRFYVNYTTVERSLRTDHLLYLTLSGHEYYQDHHLIGYAYYRLFNSTYTQSAIYIQVADGIYSNPRYLDMAAVSNDQFWEVCY